MDRATLAGRIAGPGMRPVQAFPLQVLHSHRPVVRVENDSGGQCIHDDLQAGGIAARHVQYTFAGADAPVVAVSPVVGGGVLKGPTAAFMEFAGLPCSAAPPPWE